MKSVLLALALSLASISAHADISVGVAQLRSANLKTLFKVRNQILAQAPEAKFAYFRATRTLVFAVDARNYHEVACVLQVVPAVAQLDKVTANQDCR